MGVRPSSVSEMPKVPYTDNVVPMQADVPGVTPSPTMFAMAAATMHKEGRLISAPKSLDKKAPNGNAE